MKTPPKKPSKNAEIVDRLFKFMELEGINNERLAKDLDISAQAVGKWQKTGAIALETFIAIATKYGISLDWLLTNRGTMRISAEVVSIAKPLSPQQSMILAVTEDFDDKKAGALIQAAGHIAAGRQLAPADELPAGAKNKKLGPK